MRSNKWWQSHLVMSLGVSLVIVLLGRWGGFKPIEAGVELATLPVRKVVFFLKNIAGEGVGGLKFVRNGVMRIENLEQENAQLRVEVDRLRRFGGENEELRLWAKLPQSRRLQAAAVGKIVGQIGEEVVIDQGEGEGIKEGMIVVSGGGILVGKVRSVAKWTAWVEVMTATGMEAQVRVGDRMQEGKVVGDGGKLWLEEVTQGEAVRPDESVLTSGKDEIYPPGWLVGKVGEVMSLGADVYQRAEVMVAAKASKLNFVVFLE